MRRKTTVYLDDTLLRVLKVAAARSGQHEYEVLEQALRAYLGVQLLDNVGSRSSLGEKEALALAYGELHRSRRS